MGNLKCGMMSKWLGVNKSLMALDLNRMGIDDEQGKIIGMYLRKNDVLRTLTLEGNPIAGSSFAHGPSDPPNHCLRGNGEPTGAA